MKFLIEFDFGTQFFTLNKPKQKIVKLQSPSKVTIFGTQHNRKKPFSLKMSLIFSSQTNIARQPFPYTSNCINGWDETDLDISTNVNYSLAVSQIFTC